MPGIERSLQGQQPSFGLEPTSRVLVRVGRNLDVLQGQRCAALLEEGPNARWAAGRIADGFGKQASLALQPGRLALAGTES
jgi:hypothetical protein